jgi:hypothetical protein
VTVEEAVDLFIAAEDLRQQALLDAWTQEERDTLQAEYLQTFTDAQLEMAASVEEVQPPLVIEGLEPPIPTDMDFTQEDHGTAADSDFLEFS